MNVDERLRLVRESLDTVTIDAVPDLGDLDRRRRRHRAGTASVWAVGLVVVGLVAVGVVRSTEGDGDTIAPAAAPIDEIAAAPAAPVQSSDEPAYSLADEALGWELVTVEETTSDLGVAFAGEDFTQLSVAFDVEPDPLARREGTITQTIRIGVGTYTDDLRAVYPGPGTPVTIGTRSFELVEVDEPTFTQTALVPVDLSERTFVISGRGVDSDTLTTLAGAIDPTGDTARVGSPPVGFTVIHAGAPEFATLDRGTARTYRDPVDGSRTLTVTTYSGRPISCFAYAWVHRDTDISPIGGDAGVIAQVSGVPEQSGTYEALWNVNDRTLVGITATDVTRSELIELADQLELDPAPTNAYVRPLPFSL